MPGYLTEFIYLDQAQQEAALEDQLSQSYARIGEDDAYAACIAMTNACGWSVDDFEIQSFQILTDEIRVHLRYWASGEPAEDGSALGDSLTGTAVAVIDDARNLRYEEVTAELDRIGADDDDDIINY